MNDVNLDIPVYVINLKRSPERLSVISKMLNENNIPFERIDAIDGGLLLDTEIENSTTLFCNNFCTKGAIGCFLSHQKVWKKFLSTNHSHCVVMEDDNIITNNFKKTVNEQVLSNTPFTWLGWSGIPDFFIFGSHCYLISRETAEIFLKDPVVYHVDVYKFLTMKKLGIPQRYLKDRIAYQNSTNNSSTISNNKFPILLNSILDKVQCNDISIGFILGTGILKIPVLNITITPYIIIFIILGWILPNQLKLYLLYYLCIELIATIV